MKLGVMAKQLPSSLADADQVFCYTNRLGWDAVAVLSPLGDKFICHEDIGQLALSVSQSAKEGDFILVMSNGGFSGIHEKLLQLLSKKESSDKLSVKS
jgi:UDP-N-acetylmuramate: L-alanyl-gamma-D-glutamyl-meso-diaminopimelate ligase